MKPVVSRQIEWCVVLPTTCSNILLPVSRTCSEERVFVPLPCVCENTKFHTSRERHVQSQNYLP